MPAGIQIFSDSGQLRVDYTDRLFKFMGSANVGDSYTGTAASGSIFINHISGFPYNTPFSFTLSGQLQVDGYACQHYVSGSYVYWSFPGSVASQPWTRPNTLITFGMY